MSILADENTRVLVQGLTGREGSFWTKHMQNMGTKIVAGVTPGKEGVSIYGIPVYHSVQRALAYHPADASVLFVPPRFVLDAVAEAVESRIDTIVSVAEGIPLHDTLKIRAMARASSSMVIGGNTSGVVSPGRSMLGMFPYWIKRVYKRGNIGVMTRSGSLTNEVMAMIVRAGFGISTLIGVGGDPVPGTRFAEIIPLFQDDPETQAVVLIGELGGTMEEEVAKSLEDGVLKKPLVVFLAGTSAPAGKKMGHAGAISVGVSGSAAYKRKVLEKAGAYIAERPSSLPEALYLALRK